MPPPAVGGTDEAVVVDAEQPAALAVREHAVLTDVAAAAGGIALDVDHDRRRSLLGTTALALIYACLEPAGTAAGLTLEQAVASRLNDHPEAHAAPLHAARRP